MGAGMHSGRGPDTEPGVEPGARQAHRLTRVLFAENDVGVIGGSTRALESLVRHLDRSRYQPVVMFSEGPPNPMIPAFEALGCEIVRVGPRQPSASLGAGRAARLLHGCRRAAIDVVRCVLLARAVRRLDIDLVHANNNLRVSRFALWAAKLTGVPLVCHQRFLFRGAILDRIGGRLAGRLLCISETVRASVGAQVAAAKVRVVYDGVEVPVAQPIRRPLGAPPTVAIVGRLVHWKGQHLLIEAAPRVRERVPLVRFAFVGGSPLGGHDEYAQRLEQLARANGVEDCCEFVGPVLDVERRMREDFDLVVHASTMPEPFGLVIAEAMAAGCPIVAGGLGAAPEIIEDGRSGLLFRPGDAEDLAAKIVRVLTEPGLAGVLSRGGWRRVLERFDARRTAVEVMEAWSELLAERGRAA